MNYRHAYHAGNFADVLKHIVLSLVISHLRRKPAAFRVIDTHAGAGLYDLRSSEAQKTGEAAAGIGRLLEATCPRELDALLSPFLDLIHAVNEDAQQDCKGAISFYPGSPLIAAMLMGTGDVLVANELHPQDRRTLERTLAGYANAKVLGLDGYAVLKATLPPKERRGLVLVDPPFEEVGELQRLLHGLRAGVKRFATGTFMLWYPIKDPSTVAAFKRDLSGLGLDKLLAVEFLMREPVDSSRLNGHGLILLNAPYTLPDDLGKVLPFLSEVLAQDQKARFAIETL